MVIFCFAFFLFSVLLSFCCLLLLSFLLRVSPLIFPVDISNFHQRCPERLSSVFVSLVRLNAVCGKTGAWLAWVFSLYCALSTFHVLTVSVFFSFLSFPSSHFVLFWALLTLLLLILVSLSLEELQSAFKFLAQLVGWWLNLFNTELSPERHWRRPVPRRWSEEGVVVGLESETMPNTILWWWWSLLYSAILRSRTDSLRSHVILHEWLAFYSAFLNIHQSGVLTALLSSPEWLLH